jgi:hypothetical protein
MIEGLPAFLTVEEAAALLRIGRTKAYAMVTEWRVTGGKRGLRVVDLGGVLRVPLSAIEEMAGGPLDASLLRPKVRVAKPAPDVVIDLTEPEPVIELERRPARRTRRQPADQPGLFDLPPAS